MRDTTQRMMGEVITAPVGPGMPDTISYSITLDNGQSFDGIQPTVRPGGGVVQINPAPVGTPLWATWRGGEFRVFFPVAESIFFDDECQQGVSPPGGPTDSPDIIEEPDSPPNDPPPPGETG